MKRQHLWLIPVCIEFGDVCAPLVARFGVLRTVCVRSEVKTYRRRLDQGGPGISRLIPLHPGMRRLTALSRETLLKLGQSHPQIRTLAGELGQHQAVKSAQSADSWGLLVFSDDESARALM